MASPCRLAYSFFPGRLVGESLFPPLTILHGVFGSKTNWKSIAKRLSHDLGRHVYAVDARNHGDSPHSQHMSYELMSEDTVGLLKELGVTKTVLVGHSMGGKTAMMTALRYPDMVDRLVVLDVVPNITATSTGDLQQLVTAMRSLDTSSVTDRRQADDQLKQHIPNHVVRQFLLANLVIDHKSGRSRWKINFSALEDNLVKLRAFPNIPGDGYLGRTHFIGGALSGYLPRIPSPEMKRLFPNSTIMHIPKAGHWLHYDKPKEFLKLMYEYLK